MLEDASAYEQVLSGDDLNHSDVTCLYEDSHHRLWVGTMGRGIFYMDISGEHYGEIHSLTTATGLISNEVRSIIEDEQGVVWVATRNGISCFQPATGQMSYQYDEYSLLRNTYADNSVCRLPHGRLAFGTNAGVVIYDTHQMAMAPAVSGSLSITDILVNGVSVSMMDKDAPRQELTSDSISVLHLSHQQNSLTFHFSAFNFKAASTTRYTCWLEGYDKDWSELSVYSFVTYKNLSPGRYVLHIKAYGNDARANQEQQLVIQIHRPWWSTWWAWTIYVLLGGVIVWSIYRQLRTVYELRRRISIEQKLTEYKLQFFTNISHEFRTPLTIIRGAMDRMRAEKEVLANLRQPMSSMQRSVDRMMRLINQLLEFRKMQNGKLQLALEETDIVAFVRDICQNFSDMAENKRISYQFVPSTKSFSMYIDRQHVDKIMYNLLSNAFKYTPSKGDINVRLTVKEDEVEIRVEDTGVGIPREKQPELFQRFIQSTFSNDSIGIGLHLTKALIDVHHGQIRFEENNPKGAIFVLTLPARKEVYIACLMMLISCIS